MRDPWGLNERVFAAFYPRLVALAENAGQRETRRELLSNARGRTLELGAGNGFNLPHYTSAVSELVVTEPSAHMLAQLRTALASDSPSVGTVKLVQAGAEELPFPDQSFDTVVGTYVLCTIPDPARALEEVARVLRPGGRLLFLGTCTRARGPSSAASRTWSRSPTDTWPPAAIPTAGLRLCSSPHRFR